jgi:AcrR family transcriptional regulator
MTQMLDKRIIKTIQLIKETFIELMNEKGFNQLTVRDLTTKANISRATFYLHFKDKYELLSKIENEILQELKEIICLNEANSVELFHYFQEHALFFQTILSSNGNPSFQGKLRDIITNSMKQRIEENWNKECNIPLEYTSTAISSAYLGIIQYWFYKGMVESPEEMSKILMGIQILV